MDPRLARGIRHTGKPIKRSLIVLALALAGPLWVMAWSVWERTRDPLAAIRRPLGHLDAAHDSTYTVFTASGESRRYVDVVLRTRNGESIVCTLSLPSNFVPGSEKLPVVLILGGLSSGRMSLKYVHAHGRNALVGYQYPYTQKVWYENAGPREIPRIRRAVHAVPAQCAALVEWIQQQPWADAGRVQLLGYSFGALFTPAALRVMQADSLAIATATIAFGGAGLEAIGAQNIDGPPGVRQLAVWLAGSALRPIEPELHLPHLRGEFLLISGNRDAMIPLRCAQRLQELTPDPKTIVNLDVEHLDPRRPELMQLVVQINREWLLERGAVNP